ncbi:hypothetical protein ACFQGA_11500 [Marinobacter koreensis]|uniref:Uncharacterized protein n=1 Tax=Marinobacter koreensis TaxID=335974 RepID=A0ABW0RI37_9GAMM|nr:hypothetical protein [Marinobacter koreensis]MCK7548488.1 hypothetical protein [Marinobacter koreensis]
MSRNSPGTFYNHGNSLQYIALARAADTAGLPAHEVTNAVSNGSLPVHEVSGCKCVTLADLLKLKSEVAK